MQHETHGDFEMTDHDLPIYPNKYRQTLAEISQAHSDLDELDIPREEGGLTLSLPGRILLMARLLAHGATERHGVGGKIFAFCAECGATLPTHRAQCSYLAR